MRSNEAVSADEIDDCQARQIPIPLLKNEEIQNKINALALKANQKRYQAYLAEQTALNLLNKEALFWEKNND